MINLYGHTLSELTTILANEGYSAYHTKILWEYLYRREARSLEEMTELRSDIRHWLRKNSHIHRLTTDVSTNSSDGFTRKYLLRLHDGRTIETVLMYFEGRQGEARATACISTQVGCAMGCVFCATGQMGLTRHLTAGEIVAQVLHIIAVLQAGKEKLRNIVFMGMGEPLHNYDGVMTAVAILTDPKGLAIAPKHITLSTVGIVPGIRQMADENQPIRLAVSLHAATDEKRQALVPPARRWPLNSLMAACRYYIAKRKRRIFFEWALIAGKNDSPQQAHHLGRLLQGMDAHINLIPLNPTPGFDGAPTQMETAKAFQATLNLYDLPSTIRQRRGIDIAAGCGQLKADSI